MLRNLKAELISWRVSFKNNNGRHSVDGCLVGQGDLQKMPPNESPLSQKETKKASYESRKKTLAMDDFEALIFKT